MAIRLRVMVIGGGTGGLCLAQALRKAGGRRIHKRQHTVIPPRGCGMFVAAHELADDDADDDAGGYVLWAYAAHRRHYPARVEMSELDGVGLRDLVSLLISRWHPVLRLLVAESPAESLSLLPILTSVPVPRWPATNITLLGDAIHRPS